MARLFYIPVLLFLCVSNSSFAQYDFSEVDKLIKKGNLSANAVVLIYKDGKIIYKKEKGQFNAATQKPIASCSKWLTAALVMTFVDEGKLSLDDTIGKFLPEFSEHGKGAIKIRHCLSHTTGIETPPFFLNATLSPNKFPSLEAEVHHWAVNSKLKSKPGTEFRYSGVGLNIAGRILEVIEQKDFEVIFKERLAQPLEMSQTTFNAKNWTINPSGGAYSSAHDYLQFLIMILNKGTYNGKRILSKEAITVMQTPATTLSMIKYAPSTARSFNYALGEWITEYNRFNEAVALCSPGLFGTWPLIDTRRGYACIFFEMRLLDDDTREDCMALKRAIDRQVKP